MPRGEWERKEPPCENGTGCPFESRCDRHPASCADYWAGAQDEAVDAAIDEARLRRNNEQRKSLFE